jgi:hypothetical protein
LEDVTFATLPAAGLLDDTLEEIRLELNRLAGSGEMITVEMMTTVESALSDEEDVLQVNPVVPPQVPSAEEVIAGESGIGPAEARPIKVKAAKADVKSISVDLVMKID